MKRKFMCGLVFVGLFVWMVSGSGKWGLAGGAFFNEQLGKVFAQSNQTEPPVVKREFDRVLTLQERQPIYMKEVTFIKVGELEAGQPVVIVDEDEDYYELRLGKMNVYVRKGLGTVEQNKIWVLTEQERFGAVKTARKTKVHEENDLNSPTFMQLEAGYRYSVVREEENWYIITLGERPGYIHKSSVTLDEGVPVLLYHHMIPHEKMKTTASTVSVEAFEEQIGYLAEQQFTTLSSQQLYDYLEGRLVLPAKAVLITFDDGLLSSKEYAYPILKQYGFTATQHIITSRLLIAKDEQQFDADGPIQYLTAADLVKLKDVFQFEAHTDELHELTDTHIGIGMKLSTEAIFADLQTNLTHLPGAVTLAYPYGQYNEAYTTAAKEAGLLLGFTIIEGYANKKDSNYEVRRFGMTDNRSFEQFAAYVDGTMLRR